MLPGSSLKLGGHRVDGARGLVAQTRETCVEPLGGLADQERTKVAPELRLGLFRASRELTELA
jgi:hypothetical protein